MDKDKSGSCSATPSACSTAGAGKEKCCGKMMMGALLGGILMFAWFSISWMFVPWHANTLMGFKDEKAIAKAIDANTAGSGIYVLPYTNMGKEPQKVDKPFAFVSVFADGVSVKDGMGKTMGEDFALCVVMAGLLGCCLRNKRDGYCPMALSLKLGLLTGLAAYIPNLIWYHFPVNFTLVGIADNVIAFALAGAAMSKCIFKMKFGMCKPGDSSGACGPKAGSCETKSGSCGTDKK